MAGTHSVVMSAGGFRVERPPCPPIAVDLDADGFVVRGAGPDVRVPLWDAAAVASVVEERLRSGPRPKGPLRGPAPTFPPARMLVGHVSLHRDRLLPRLDAETARVRDAVRAAADHVPTLIFHPALRAARWVRHDVLAFRAAALALAWVEVEMRPDGADTPEALVAALGSWRGLYSPTGTSYRSLDRTLMNLPAGFPGQLAPVLRRIRLERPVTCPLVLTALCLAADAVARRGHGTRCAPTLRVFQHATTAEVTAMVDAVGLATRRRLSAQRRDDLRTAVLYVTDHPEPYGGRLEGLVARAIAWHRVPGPADDPAPGPATALPPALPVARPPVPLPAVPGIVFLDTVGAIAREGEEMGHCIADYARDARDGHCYLFRVTHAGERASVEVSPAGDVVQACGPRNASNAAVRWGMAKLRAWGRQLLPPERRLAATAARRRRDAMRAAQLRFL